MMAAAIVITVLLNRRSGARSRGWVIAGFAVLVFALIGILGLEQVLDRVLSIRDTQQAQGSRLEILRDLVQLWRRFPIFGTGLGTHQVVFPMVDRSRTFYVASHAENEYAQILTETGAIGLPWS